MSFLQIPLSDETHARLKSEAALAGESMRDYVAKLLGEPAAAIAKRKTAKRKGKGRST